MNEDALPPIDLWEAMSTARAFRSFTLEPVDDATLVRCLRAATWAPSGGNQQPWRFVVLRSPATRAVVAAGAAAALAVIEKAYGFTPPAEDDTSRQAGRTRQLYSVHRGAADLPAVVLFCVHRQEYVPDFLLGASIFPAMQNFLLAARAQGLGALITGWASNVDEQLRNVVGIPQDWVIGSLVVAGWPQGKPGPVRRKPVEAVTALDSWDRPLVDPDS